MIVIHLDEDNTVVNFIEVENITDVANCLEWEDGVNLGDKYINGEFIKPVIVLPVPETVSPRQIRQALTKVGLRADVESTVAASSQDIKDWYEFATAFERSSGIVAVLASKLNVTDTQLDNLWTLAAGL